MAKEQPSMAEFRILTLGEADKEYAATEERLAEISRQHSQEHREVEEIEADMRARPAPAIRPGVAALLGEDIDTSLHQRPEKLKSKRQAIADLEAATEILRRLLTDRRGHASAAVCEKVRPEYGRRVARLAEALQAVADARDDYEQLCDDLEANDVSWLQLGIFKPTWLGDRRDGHIQRFVREAKEAGYYG